MGRITTGAPHDQETDDAIFTLQSCTGEPARQLAAKTFFLARPSQALSQAFSWIHGLIRTRSLCARALTPTRENMSRKRFSKKQMQPLCGKIHSDDGVDPAEFFRPTRKRKSNDHKAQQLCHQVADTLNLVLSGEFGEELRDLRVVAVTPAPDASQLLVLVAPAIAGGNIDPQAVPARLATAAGRLRAGVAAAITRRHAPKLLFQFVAGQSAGEVQP